MPDLNLDEIEKRCEKATPGPWEQRPRTVGAEKREVDCEIVGRVDKVHKCSTPVARLYTGFIWYEGDKDFIAHARTDIPALVDEVKRLREGKEELRATFVRLAVQKAHERDEATDNALEEAAKICDAVEEHYLNKDYHKYPENSTLAPTSARECAEKIRALKTNKGE